MKRKPDSFTATAAPLPFRIPRLHLTLSDIGKLSGDPELLRARPPLRKSGQEYNSCTSQCFITPGPKNEKGLTRSRVPRAIQIQAADLSTCLPACLIVSSCSGWLLMSCTTTLSPALWQSRIEAGNIIRSFRCWSCRRQGAGWVLQKKGPGLAFPVCVPATQSHSMEGQGAVVERLVMDGAYRGSATGEHTQLQSCSVAAL